MTHNHDIFLGRDGNISSIDMACIGEIPYLMIDGWMMYVALDWIGCFKMADMMRLYFVLFREWP